MMTTQARTPRPKLEDYLRAVGYLNLMAWAAVFYIFPPVTFLSEVAQFSRFLWLSVAFLGGAMAFAGALARIDIKLELPGILVAMVGPVFYSFSQFYLATNPLPGADEHARTALVVYALLGVTLLLPRLVSLIVAKNRLKELNR